MALRGRLFAFAFGLSALGACSTDLFHSTEWTPSSTGASVSAGPSASSSGGTGGGGGEGAPASASSSGGGGAGGAGGSCAHCMDGFEQGGLQANFCSGSQILFIQIGQCLCTNCADECLRLCQLMGADAGAPSDACLQCATVARAGTCKMQYDACVADGTD